jgi:hypothetical protein
MMVIRLGAGHREAMFWQAHAWTAACIPQVLQEQNFYVTCVSLSFDHCSQTR